MNYKEKPGIAKKAVKEMGMTYPVALDTDGRIFEIFARGGVTRNIILDENLNIIFLTRLFNKEEFDQMKAAIKNRLKTKPNKQDQNFNKGEEVIQTKLQDLSGQDKEIFLEYNGSHKIHLEGKIFSSDKKKLEIGISLFNEDVVSGKYDKKTKKFRIGYRHYDGVRIAILPMTKFTVPRDVEKVCVFDVE